MTKIAKHAKNTKINTIATNQEQEQLVSVWQVYNLLNCSGSSSRDIRK